MVFHRSFTSLVTYLFLFSSVLSAASTVSEDFISCLTEKSYTSIRNVVYAPDNSSFESVLDFSAKNSRFTTSATPKPSFIITPGHESHIQAAVICSKRHGFLLRVRSGGHDYEGQSSTAPTPFVIIDMFNFRDIDVDIKSNSAWAQIGATVGEVTYRIAEKSNTHGFPTPIIPTVGIGGFIAGGGLGYLWRKYGLAADNVIDVKFVDVNGKLHDRRSMGEDLFWALRGGGGNSFGVIVAWRLQLVRVPPLVTVFRVRRTLEQNGSSLFYKWQSIAYKLPKDLFVGVLIETVAGESNRTIQFSFESSFQGRREALLPLMEKNFPELGLTAEDCTEMSWVNSTLFIASASGQPVEYLLNRTSTPRSFWKGKSDFVEKAIPMQGLEGLWKIMLADNIYSQMGIEPMGGRMSEIPESAIAFPHRKGNMYAMRYYHSWQDESAGPSNIEKLRRIYKYVAPFVSKSPRGAYLNYKDLDLGFNRDRNTCYSEARVWGASYYNDNFERLAKVKSKVDPENYFWGEQSIPLYARRCNEAAYDIIQVSTEENSYAQ